MSKKADLLKRATESVRTKAHERTGIAYEPFLTVNDVSSKGFRWRIYSKTVGRQHHLLSSIEAAMFFSLEALPNVTDIREQVLFPPDASIALAESMGLKHPKAGGKTHPMTFDLWASFNDRPDKIYSAKSSEDLTDRVVAKLLLEKACADQLGVEWALVTERRFGVGFIAAIEWSLQLHDAEKLPELHIPLDAARTLTLEFLMLNRGRPLNLTCDELDRRLDQRAGTALSICRHLIAIRMLDVDFSQGIDTTQPLRIRDGEAA